MKKLILMLAFFALFLSCEDTKDPVDNENPPAVEYMDLMGGLELDNGPHDLAVKDNFVFACRDDKIYLIDIADGATPVLIGVLDDLENSNNFETLLVDGNLMYAGCTSLSAIYVFDISDPENTQVIGYFADVIYSDVQLSPMKFFKKGNVLWAAGSNGTNGMLVKLNATDNGTLTFNSYWVATTSGSAVGGVWANDNNVFVSTANGYIYSFDAANISAGQLDEYTFSAEAGHEHWGKTIVGDGDRLYWADWGAGFITVNISNPANLSAEALITHSSYKQQHPDAEGTNLYDLYLDKTAGKVYVANGWSGFLVIDIDEPDKVEAFVDYTENQYFCIEKIGDYVIMGDIAEGISDYKGIKVYYMKQN